MAVTPRPPRHRAGTGTGGGGEKGGVFPAKLGVLAASVKGRARKSMSGMVRNIITTHLTLIGQERLLQISELHDIISKSGGEGRLLSPPPSAAGPSVGVSPGLAEGR